MYSELNAQFESLAEERNKLKKEVTEGYKKTTKSLEARNVKAVRATGTYEDIYANRRIFKTAQSEEAIESLKTLKRKEKDRMKNILKAKDDISKLQAKVDNPPDYEDVEALAREMVCPLFHCNSCKYLDYAFVMQEPIRTQSLDLKVKRTEFKGQADALMREVERNSENIHRAKYE